MKWVSFNFGESRNVYWSDNGRPFWTYSIKCCFCFTDNVGSRRSLNDISVLLFNYEKNLPRNKIVKRTQNIHVRAHTQISPPLSLSLAHTHTHTHTTHTHTHTHTLYILYIYIYIYILLSTMSMMISKCSKRRMKPGTTGWERGSAQNCTRD